MFLRSEEHRCITLSKRITRIFGVHYPEDYDGRDTYEQFTPTLSLAILILSVVLNTLIVSLLLFIPAVIVSLISLSRVDQEWAEILCSVTHTDTFRTLRETHRRRSNRLEVLDRTYFQTLQHLEVISAEHKHQPLDDNFHSCRALQLHSECIWLHEFRIGCCRA
jgi:hypothetical protein